MKTLGRARLRDNKVSFVLSATSLGAGTPALSPTPSPGAGRLHDTSSAETRTYVHKDRNLSNSPLVRGEY